MHRDYPLNWRSVILPDSSFQGLADSSYQTLTHDLWALRLQQIASRVSYESETNTEAAASQVFSSQSEGRTSPASTETRRSKRSAYAEMNRKKPVPNLLDAAALSYIAILLLREPVTVADIYSWMRDGQLLYYRAVQEIPLSMRERLPGTYQELLEPSTILRPRKLQSVVLSLLCGFSVTFGMAFPQINHLLVLYRWTRDLLLPIECYAGASRLARLLSIDFSVTTPSSLDRIEALRSPEVRLMVLLMMATKLLFPLDNMQRYPSSASDLSALRMDWTIWVSAFNMSESGELQRNFAANLNTSPSQIQTLSEKRLDDYLDWYESNIASEDIRAHFNSKGTKDDTEFRRTMFELFPASGPYTRASDGNSKAKVVYTKEENTEQALRTVQASLKPKPIVPVPIPSPQRDERDVTRAGSFYKQYRRKEDLPADNTVPIRLLYEAAAEKAGIDLESLVRAVFAMEKRLEKVEDGLRRKSDLAATDYSEVDSSEAESDTSENA
nr:rna polymerase i-specific transcription initiation factor rrn7 [Quercus suber]